MCPDLRTANERKSEKNLQKLTSHQQNTKDWSGETGSVCVRVRKGEKDKIMKRYDGWHAVKSLNFTKYDTIFGITPNDSPEKEEKTAANLLKLASESLAPCMLLLARLIASLLTDGICDLIIWNDAVGSIRDEVRWREWNKPTEN